MNKPQPLKTRNRVQLAAWDRKSAGAMADRRTRRNRTRGAQQRRAIGEYR